MFITRNQKLIIAKPIVTSDPWRNNLANKFKRDLRRIIVTAVLLLSGCQRAMPTNGIWGGTVELADAKLLPFRFDLDLRNPTPTGFFLVGDEQTPIPEISRQGDALAFRFSEYGAEMSGTWDGRRWKGAYRRFRPGGTTSLNFTASPEAANPSDGGSPRVSVPVGKYQVSFADEQRSTTLATLWTTGEALYGTFIAPDGDYGLLVGRPAAGSVQLNRFTGWQAMAIVLEQHGETWSGQFYTQSEKPRRFTLESRTDLELQTPPNLQTRLKDPAMGFVFEGESLSGTVTRSSDARFKGRPLVVDIMGTWCHNCMDEAPLLQQLEDQYGSKGLEVVGVSFEINDDRELAKKNLKLYQERFGLTFTILFAGSIDDANVNSRLRSQLDNFFAYPTTLFINKDGKVQAIHSGFKGPGTGTEFQSQMREFHDLAKKLVE